MESRCKQGVRREWYRDELQQPDEQKIPVQRAFELVVQILRHKVKGRVFGIDDLP